MNLFQKIFKQTAYRFRDSKFTTIFLTLSLVMSIMLISIGTSFVTQFIRATEAKEKAMPPNACQVSFYCEENGTIKMDRVYQMLNQLNSNEGAIVNDILVHLDGNDNVNGYSPVSAEYFKNDGGWHYPIANGRNYTKDEIQQGKKVALVGKSFEDNLKSENGKQYLSIEGEKYEVIGRVGLGNQISLWDNRIFIPATALPPKTLENYNTSGVIRMILYSNVGQVDTTIDRMLETGKRGMKDLAYENNGPLGVDDVVQDIVNNADNIFFLAILGYLVTLIYSINIVQFWITKRRYEIGVRKAFGYTNGNIVAILMEEMLGILGIAFLGAMLVQFLLRITVGSLMGYTLELYFENLLVGLIVVVITTIFVALCSIRKVLKISPAVVLKEGQSNE